MNKTLKILAGTALVLMVLVGFVYSQGLQGGPLIGNNLYQPVVLAKLGYGTAITSTVYVAGFKYVGVQVVSSNTVANTNNTVVQVNCSLDGEHYQPYSTITLANTGSATTQCQSNYNPQTHAYWQLICSSTVTNGGAVLPTNIVTITVNRVQ